MAALLLLLMLFLFSSISCDELPENLCDRIQCEPLHCDGIRVERVVGPGKCCPGCIQVQYDLGLNARCTPQDTWKRNFDVDPYITVRDCKFTLKCTNSRCKENTDRCFAKFNEPINVDEWKPNCERNGDYKGRQCDKEVCFCFDISKKRIFGRSNYFDADNMTCVCSRKAMEFKDGYYSCHRNGDFAPIQCLTTHCFCADTATGEITSQILPKPLASFLPCYTEELFLQYFGAPCIMERNSKQPLIDYLKNIGLKEQPNGANCDPDGSYAPVQMYGLKKRCVLPNGETSSEEFPANSEIGSKMDCLCNRENWELQQEGRPDNLPCLKNGNYEVLAFNNDGTSCFCVEYGFKVSVAMDIERLDEIICANISDAAQEKTIKCYRSYKGTSC